MAGVLPTFENKRVYTTSKNDLDGKEYDIIVIGSGMGGMSCAAALSNFGKKVLVLEQHYLPGGYTHMFTRKGYSWDVGVHAIGEVGHSGQLARAFNWLSKNKVKWNSLGKSYDSFYYPDNYSIEFPDDKNVFIDRLKTDFPLEKTNIDNYFKLVKKATKESKTYFAYKLLPEKLGKVLSNITYRFQRNWWEVTTEVVLKELGLSDKLITVLTAQWGYHGNIPGDSSFAIHAMIVKHFSWGAFYPVGGSKSIAAALLSQVEEAGGNTLCRASVDQILLKGNKAIGVRLQSGEEFFAKKIISAISVKKSIDLIPKNSSKLNWFQEIKSIPDSPPYICVNLAFKGDIKSAGASSTNMWFMNTYDRTQGMWKFSNSNTKVPILYVSFPSLKDPKHDAGEEQMHTGEAITFIPYEMFKQWSDTVSRKRGDDYIDLKSQIESQVLELLKTEIPEIMKYCVYSELSTPLTAEYYINANKGAIYGLDSSPKRFNCSKLRPRTPIKNFYLSGVDIATTGVSGAMIGGLMTASCIEPRVIPKML